MKKGLFTLAIIFTFGILITSCKTSEKKEHDKVHVKEHLHAEKTVYQCPMKCEEEKTYEKEGACPVCEMKLRKKAEQQQHEAHH
ncbi:hypothetical protein N9P84_02390 [Polaribacter sp.]|nr:hypothetical protein [Polaribacter sp.]